METIMKNFFLYLSKNKAITKTAKKHGLKFGAKRFVSGETIESGIQISKILNQKGIQTTLDHLGEFVLSKEEAIISTNHCIQTLEEIHKSGVKANLSLKLTQIGLDISEKLVMDNMRSILQKARETNNFVRIDMEDYSRNHKTLDIFRTLKNEFPNEVGLVIQAYLFKSLKDIKDLNNLHPNLRLCKGAYKEGTDVAFPEKGDVDDNYKKMIETHLLNGNYAAIATHDEKIIAHVLDFVEKNTIPKTQFEFQMLYGIQNNVLEELAQKGYNTRIYIPFGDDWYGYFMRRLAERPANVWFVLKNLTKA